MGTRWWTPGTPAHWWRPLPSCVLYNSRARVWLAVTVCPLYLTVWYRCLCILTVSEFDTSQWRTGSWMTFALSRSLCHLSCRIMRTWSDNMATTPNLRRILSRETLLLGVMRQMKPATNRVPSHSVEPQEYTLGYLIQDKLVMKTASIHIRRVTVVEVWAELWSAAEAQTVAAPALSADFSSHQRQSWGTGIHQRPSWTALSGHSMTDIQLDHIASAYSSHPRQLPRWQISERSLTVPLPPTDVQGTAPNI